jgi:hypothetical protein
MAMLGVTAAFAPTANAQLKPHPTPFTIRFDTASLLAERAQMTLPLWLQGVTVRHYRADVEQMQITVVRFDLRQMKSLAPFVELRVGLAPGVGQAVVTAWNELGRQVFRSKPFGSTTEFLTETVRVATEGANYLEIELPKTGERLQSLYAGAMRFAQVLQPVDFSPEPVFDAFGNAARTSPPSDQDSLLWNRVLAVLDAGPFTLHPDRPETLEFQISRRPEVALLTFEIRNAIADNPPVFSLNGSQLPAAAPILPDFADPAWRIRPVPGATHTLMRYGGWMRTQQFLPSHLLLEGVNHIDLVQDESSESVEVRRVEIQLRYRR